MNRWGSVNVVAFLAILFGWMIIISSWPPAFGSTNKINYQAVQQVFDGEDIHQELLESHRQLTALKVDDTSQAFQIKILIGVVIFLFGGNMWWIRNYMAKQDEAHELQVKVNDIIFAKMDESDNKLHSLIGEHRRSMAFNGCAADPEVMEKTLNKILKPFLDYHIHIREGDKTDEG